MTTPRSISPEFRAEVLNGLTPEFSRAREVWRRLGRWAPRTVRAVLGELADEGAIEREIVPITGGVVHRYRRLALIALAAIWLPIGGAHARTLYAIDGDTLNVEATGERIRLYGIDAPELHPARCEAERRLGEAAKHELQALVDMGPVQIERITTDRYGRTVARILVGGHDVGPFLIARGLARPYSGHERRQSWCVDQG